MIQRFLAVLIICSFTAVGYSKSSSTQKQSGLDATQISHRFASWGINPSFANSNINLSKAWKVFRQKSEVIVAVIDTGIDPKHNFLSKNIHIVGGKANAKNFGMDFSKGSKNLFSPSDSHGHGTHVSGIVKSVFPKVKILPLKYYNPSASGQDNLDSTIKALEYAVKSNVDIINYSGGGPEPSSEELRVLKKAERKGILVVAAAGNERSNIDDRKKAYYPASYGLSNIITVTAHNQALAILASSNYGKKSVDLSAPGYRIKSSIPHGRAGYMTGTSQATAFVSGVAALLKSQYPSLSAIQLKKIIISSATKSNTLVGKCKTAGKLDAYAALQRAQKAFSPTIPVIKKKDDKKRGLARLRKKAKGKVRYFRISK